MIQNKISNKYIKNLFKLFKQNKKVININMDQFKYYPRECIEFFSSSSKVSSSDLSLLIKFTKISNIFNECTQIKCDMDNGNEEPTIIPSLYLSCLLSEISSINNSSLKIINLFKCKCSIKDVIHNKQLFNDKGCDIKLKDYEYKNMFNEKCYELKIYLLT